MIKLNLTLGYDYDRKKHQTKKESSINNSNG